VTVGNSMIELIEIAIEIGIVIEYFEKSFAPIDSRL